MASPQTVINLVCFPFLSKKSAKPYRSSLFAFILCFLMKLRGKQTETAREANIGQILAHQRVWRRVPKQFAPTIALANKYDSTP